MNRKPSWGLWLLMIVAPVAVFFGIRYWENLPPPLAPLNASVAQQAAQGTPLISDVRITGDGSNPMKTSFGFDICNPTRDKVTARVVVVSGVSEIIQSPGTAPLKNGSGLGGFSLGNGDAGFQVFYDIKTRRKQPIKLKLYWTHGLQSGVKNVVITPQMK